MDYIKSQDKNISKISVGHQKWYQADSGVWGERYMKEKEHVLTRERSKKETRIIVKYLPQKCKKILDAPCGYGRISNSLSALSYEVTGIDINDYFINLARKQATQKGLKVSYIAGDILKKKALGKFDAVLNIFTSLGYLENDKKNELFIGKLCQYVKSGGSLIIETINPVALVANYKKKETATLKDGTRLYFERLLDFRTSTSVTKIQEVKQNSSPKNLVHIIRIYYPHELINICRKFDCNLVEMLDQNGKAKDIKNSLRIWLIFKKKYIERVRAIIIDSNKILLINRVKGENSYWVLPGGRVERGESHEYAIKRECIEELGIKIRVQRLFLRRIGDKPGMEGQYEFFYLCDMVGGKVGTGRGPEFQPGTQYKGEYRISWVDLKKLPDLNLKSEEIKDKIIQEYLLNK